MLFSQTKEKPDFFMRGEAACPRSPSMIECKRFLSQMTEFVDLENSDASQLGVLSNKLATALLYLNGHNGFVFDKGIVELVHPGDGIKSLPEQNEVVEILRGIYNRVCRCLLSSALHPSPLTYATRFQQSNAKDKCRSKTVSAIAAFENYCALVGCDVACAALRDQRANWLHGGISGTLSHSRLNQSNAGSVTELPVRIVSLIDGISMQCDSDLVTVMQTAGRSRWRQFAELYQTAANDAASRVKHQAALYLQSVSQPSTTEISCWLLACLRAEQLRSRESFLHQLGQCVSVRPKSGGLLKTGSRPFSGDAEQPFLAATISNNDVSLAKLFSDAIAVTYNVASEVTFESISVNKVIAVSCQADTERWPKTISKYCWSLWDTFGTFIQLFVIESKHHSALLQPSLDNVASVLRSFITHRCRQFAEFVVGDLARQELAAYLAISDVSFIERQLNSIKVVLASSIAAHSLQSITSELRELVRCQLDAMHARVIAINARLLLESLLSDWRRLPGLEAGVEGPPCALVAWLLHLGMWHQRISLILPPSAASHIYLSVALASFERITVRLVNSCGHPKSVLSDVNLALSFAFYAFFLGVRSPELVSSNFTYSLSVAGGSAIESSELRDLVASFNSLANTLFSRFYGKNACEEKGFRPTRWIVQALGITFDEENDDDMLILFLLLATACSNSNNLLTVRLICSPKILGVLMKEIVSASKEDIHLLLVCLKAASSTNVHPLLFSRAVEMGMLETSDPQSFSSQVCELLIDDIFQNNSCLELISHKCRMRYESCTILRSLPCGCSYMDIQQRSFCFDNFINSVPNIFESLDLSIRLAVGAYDRASNTDERYFGIGGMPCLLAALIRRCLAGHNDESVVTPYSNELLHVASYLENGFVDSANASRRKIHQVTDDTVYDGHLKSVIASIRKLTTERLCLDVLNSGRMFAEPQAESGAQRHMCNDGDGDITGKGSHSRAETDLEMLQKQKENKAIITEAEALEILAAMCSFSQGLENLARLENTTAKLLDKIFHRLFRLQTNFDVPLHFLKTASSGDAFMFATNVISIARNSFHPAFSADDNIAV